MKQRTILITGTTRGLGLAMAEEFARQGHIVLGCGSGTKRVNLLAKKLGSPHDISRVDVSSDEEVKAWAKRLLKEYGPPDLLINNAGVINKNAALWEISSREFSQVIDVNIKGVTNVIRHFVPTMIEHGSGIIINFSSTWGRSVSSLVAPYCATKWAIEGLTKAMAEELPSGLAAVALNPGVINTDMLKTVFEEHAEAYPEPGEWAENAVPYLLKLTPRQNGKSLSISF